MGVLRCDYHKNFATPPCHKIKPPPYDSKGPMNFDIYNQTTPIRFQGAYEFRYIYIKKCHIPNPLTYFLDVGASYFTEILFQINPKIVILFLKYRSNQSDVSRGSFLTPTWRFQPFFWLILWFSGVRAGAQILPLWREASPLHPFWRNIYTVASVDISKQAQVLPAYVWRVRTRQMFEL